MNLQIIVLSFVSSILFGIIGSSLFLAFEQTVQKKFDDSSVFDKTSAELATDGITTSITIFIATSINLFLSHHFHIIHSPFIDSLGVIIGTIIVILIYILFKYLLKK